MSIFRVSAIQVVKVIFYILYLISRNCDELCRGKSESFDNFLNVTSGSCVEAAFNFDNVNSRLILVEAVQHDLALAGCLVGQFYFGEADGVLGPVAAVVW